MAKTATDYLARIAALKASYLDALWSVANGWWQDAAGLPDAVANAALVQTIAILAHQGAASETDKSRIRTVIPKLLAAPCYASGTWWSHLDGVGDRHPARDQPISEGLFYAYQYRADLGLDAGVAASILALLTSHRVVPTSIYESADSLSVTAGSGTWNNQNLADWQFNVIAYAHLLGSDQTTQLQASAKRFIDLIDGPTPEQADAYDPDTYLLADFGWWYIPGMPWNSWEYGAMNYGKFVLRYPELAAALNLTAGEIARVKAWQRHHLGQWQRNGYPNWDTSYSDWRLHSTTYWLWGLISLVGMARATDLNQGASDHLYAKWLLDQAIDTWDGMDTWRGDAADGVPPDFPYGTVPQPWGSYDARQRANTWGRFSSAAKFAAYLAQAVDLGVADQASADPGNLWGWNWTDRSVYVSTTAYHAASLPNAPQVNIWGNLDGVQLQHYGVSRIAEPGGQILTGTGGYGREAFSLLVSRSGATQIDTGNRTTPATSQQVWVDGALQSRTPYDTQWIVPAFSTSLRQLCTRTGGAYRAEVDTTFGTSKITTTHRAVLTGAAGPASVVMSIPLRRDPGGRATIEYVAADGTTTVVWNGSTVTAAGSPAPDACRYIHIKWPTWGAGLALIPKSATLGSGAKVTALSYDPNGYPRRQPDQDRSLLVYLADSTVANVGTVEIEHVLALTDGTDASAATAWAAERSAPVASAGAQVYVGGARVYAGSAAVKVGP